MLTKTPKPPRPTDRPTASQHPANGSQRGGAAPRLWNVRDKSHPADAVYIGRRTGKWPASKWGNPFKVGQDGTREEVVAKYEQHLVESGLIDDVPELRGRDLLCWCAPEACHGDVLLRLANDASDGGS